MDTTVRILSVFLNRWLYRAETDTDRILRKLIEFGYYFSGSGAQKQFFSAAKKIIAGSDSKYYILARNLFSSVSKDRLADFGIAFGYYGLAKNSRFSGERHFSREKTCSVAAILPPRTTGTCVIELSSEFGRLSQSGINIFFIFADELNFSERELCNIIEKSPRKAFFVFTSDEDLLMKLSQKNVMPVLDLNSEDYDRLSEQLRNRRQLFGGFVSYGEESAKEAISTEFLDYVYDCGCPFLLLKEDGVCSASTHEKVSAFSYAEKRKPSHAVFVSDIIGDLECLNNTASRKYE
ncbi:MAG: hypothetical protein QMB62_09600 [Oscillospiraceae bacterium]